MPYNDNVKAALDHTENWSAQDDGKPLDFVIASALATWEARTQNGPWYVSGDLWISRAEYVAHRIMAVIERTGSVGTRALDRKP